MCLFSSFSVIFGTLNCACGLKNSADPYASQFISFRCIDWEAPYPEIILIELGAFWEEIQHQQSS
jgi:hypothetical protein